MFFTIKSIKEVKQDDRNPDLFDYITGVGPCALLDLFIATAVGGTGFGIGAGVYEGKKNDQIEIANNNIAKIEKNIQSSTSFENFTHSAFTVAREGDSHYSTVFGYNMTTPESGDVKPEYVSVSYRIPQDLYEAFVKNIATSYNVNEKEIPFSIKNSRIVPNTMFGELDSLKSYNEILEKLVKVTEQEVLATQVYGEVSSTNEAISKSEGEHFAVSAISPVVVDEHAGATMFTIDLVSSQKTDEVAAKKLFIAVPLTVEIANDPAKAYEFYANHPEMCVVEPHQVGEKIIASKAKNGSLAIAKVDTSVYGL